MHSTTILPSTQTHLKPTTKQCKHCGQAFEPAYNTAKRQKFCSDQCRYAAKQKRQHYERYQYICQQCNAPYKTAYKERDKFCSRECAFAHKAAKPKLPNERPMLDCQQCGGAFDQKTTELFCSDECRKIYNARKTKEKAERKHTPARLLCKECGGAFEPGYASKRRSFCGAACADKWQSSNSLNSRARKYLRSYYGKLTVEIYTPISSQNVYTRDNWLCGICALPIDQQAKPGEPFSASVDHIVPLSRGGIHTYANVQAAHHLCNRRKGST